MLKQLVFDCVKKALIDIVSSMDVCGVSLAPLARQPAVDLPA